MLFFFRFTPNIISIILVQNSLNQQFKLDFLENGGLSANHPMRRRVLVKNSANNALLTYSLCSSLLLFW